MGTGLNTRNNSRKRSECQDRGGPLCQGPAIPTLLVPGSGWGCTGRAGSLGWGRKGSKGAPELMQRGDIPSGKGGGALRQCLPEAGGWELGCAQSPQMQWSSDPLQGRAAQQQ